MFLINLKYLTKSTSVLRNIWFKQNKSYHISVEPQSCLQDIQSSIRATGLKPNEKATVTVRTTDDKGEEFFSFAYYKASEKGCIDLERDVSVGGTYSGCLPMGLISSLRSINPEKRYQGFVKKNAEYPIKLNIGLLPGHIDGDKCLEATGDCVASVSHERHYMAEGCRKFVVREGKLRGSLFLPPGPGPFPGIVDIYGSNGGLKEIRAAQFASKGIAAFALAYFRYDDLPKLPTELDFDYFESAVHYLLRQKEVNQNGIGAIGSSKGGDVAMSMGIYLKEVKAVIGVNTIPANTFWPLKMGNKIIPALEPDGARAVVKDGLVYPREMINSDDNPETLLPLEKADAEFMLVVGNDDQNWHSEMECKKAVEKLKSIGHSNFEIVECPGTGHLLEPPYGQVVDRFFHNMSQMHLFEGGNLNEHSVSEKMAWLKMIKFFKDNLSGV